jgi:hypothetical protein
MHRNCAKKRTEEETCTRDTEQASEAPWRRRARETAHRQRECAVRALGVEERVIAQEARRVKCGGGAHLCGGESVQGTLGCAQGTRGGRRVRSALEWQGGVQTTNGLVVCPTVLGAE